MMRLVVVESPHRAATPAQLEHNLAYGRAALADCVARGEAPIASHLLLTQPGVLDDTKPEERAKGIATGHAWIRRADVVAFYIDLGFSSGMAEALLFVLAMDIVGAADRFEYRFVPGWSK